MVAFTLVSRFYTSVRDAADELTDGFLFWRILGDRCGIGTRGIFDHIPWFMGGCCDHPCSGRE